MRCKIMERLVPLLLDDRVDVTQAQDHVLLAVQIELGPAVLGVDDNVTHRNVHGLALAVLEDLARSHGTDGAALAFLPRSVGQYDDTCRGMRLFAHLDDNLVAQGLEAHACFSISHVPSRLFKEDLGYS